MANKLFLLVFTAQFEQIGNGVSGGGEVSLPVLAVAPNQEKAQGLAEKGLKPLTRRTLSQGQYSNIVFARATELPMNKSGYVGLLQM